MIWKKFEKMKLTQERLCSTPIEEKKMIQKTFGSNEKSSSIISNEEAEKKLDILLAEQRMDFHFGKPEKFNKPLTYCITDRGMFQVRKNRIGTFIAKVEKFDSFPKGELEEKMEFLLPKVPLELLHHTIGFFKKINEEHSTEAHVQFIYDTEKKEYFIFVPEQNVSAASVKYENKETDEILKNPNKILVLDIHSHSTMGAFWSGTDDKDEKRDQIYGVIGHIDRELPEMKFRYACGGQHVDIAIEEVFATPIPKYTFPEEWMKKVKETKKWEHSTYNGNYPHYGYSVCNSQDHFGYDFSRDERAKKEKEAELNDIIDKYNKGNSHGIHNMTEREWEQSEGMVMPDDKDIYDRESWESKRDWCDPFADKELEEALETMSINDLLDSIVDREREDWIAIVARIMHEDPTLINQVINKCNHRRKKNGTDV